MYTGILKFSKVNIDIDTYFIVGYITSELIKSDFSIRNINPTFNMLSISYFTFSLQCRFILCSLFFIILAQGLDPILISLRSQTMCFIPLKFHGEIDILTKQSYNLCDHMFILVIPYHDQFWFILSSNINLFHPIIGFSTKP